jgi:hypothetical protein
VTEKEEEMRRIIAIAAGAALLALSGATPSLAAENVAFQAELHHFTAPAGPCENGVCKYLSHGYGFSNLMGPLVRVTVYFVWDFNTTPCSTLDPLVFRLVGETGSITISGSGSICPGANPELSFPQFFSGAGEITGGTGEFSGITGSVTSQGTLGPNGPIVHLTGDVSY